MLTKMLKAAGAAGAMMMAAPLLAQAHGGGHAGGPPGGMPSGAMGGMNMGAMQSQGPTYASPVGISHANQNSVLVRTTTPPTTTVGTTNYSSNSQAAANSQALLHASPTAIAHASPNSVLARGAVNTTTLAGIATGQTVTNTTGSLGTVSQIIYGPDQSTIRAVVVTGTNGQTYTLPANSLVYANGALTTTYGG